MAKVSRSKPSSRPAPKKKTSKPKASARKSSTKKSAASSSSRKASSTRKASSSSQSSATRSARPQDRVDIGPQETPSSRLPNVSGWSQAGAGNNATRAVAATGGARSGAAQQVAQLGHQAQSSLGHQLSQNSNQNNGANQAQKNNQNSNPNPTQNDNAQQNNGANPSSQAENSPTDGNGNPQVDPSKLPEGVSLEDALATGQRIGDLVAFGTHLPGMLQMGKEIEQNGFNAEHIQKLKEAMPALQKVLTPENIQAFKNMNPDQIDQLLSPQNLEVLQAVSPELASQLTPEKIKELKGGISNAQQALDKNNIARTMNFLGPFVGTAQQEGVLPMMARMIDDPSKLGGADRALSLTDVGPVVNGLLNTRPIANEVSSRIPQEAHKLVERRPDGTRRRPLVRALGHRFVNNNPGFVQRKGWEFVRSRGPGMARQAARPYLSSQGSPMDARQRRTFTNQEAQTMLDAGQRLQQARGFQSSGNTQNDRVQAATAAATQIIDKSLRGDDGMISAQEARNVADAGTMLYQTLGSLYTGLGGAY